MTTSPQDFDGCRHACRQATAHTLVWGECEHAPAPEPTVSMSAAYKAADGFPAIGFDTYTVEQLAELLDPVLGSEAMRARKGSVDLAHLAAHTIVHRNDASTAPGNGPEYARCVACGHIEPEHRPDAGPCLLCDCAAYRPVSATVPAAAPQPAAPAVWIDGHPQLEAIAAAVWEACGRSDSGACVEDDPRNIAVAALAAVLPAPVDRTAELSPAERQFLTFALDQAAEEMSLGDGSTDEDEAALDKLRRLADETQPTQTEAAPERRLCGKTRGVSGLYYQPCARDTGHTEAYCRSADGEHVFLAAQPMDTDQGAEQ